MSLIGSFGLIIAYIVVAVKFEPETQSEGLNRRATGCWGKVIGVSLIAYALKSGRFQKEVEQ
jgi:hypothetical protein